MLGIDKDNYKAIPRFYTRDDKTIRYSVEMNYLRVHLMVDGLEKVF
jgi:hypothetical protein